MNFLSLEYYSKAVDIFLDKPTDPMNTFDMCYKKAADIYALKGDINKQIEGYRRIVERHKLCQSLLNAELSLADLIFNDFLKKPSMELPINDKRYVIVIVLYINIIPSPHIIRFTKNILTKFVVLLGPLNGVFMARLVPYRPIFAKLL